MTCCPASSVCGAELDGGARSEECGRACWELAVHVADGRKQEALEAYFADLGPEARAWPERIAMGMWAPYIAATRAKVPDADERIVFDELWAIRSRLARIKRVARRIKNR